MRLSVRVVAYHSNGMPYGSGWLVREDEFYRFVLLDGMQTPMGFHREYVKPVKAEDTTQGIQLRLLDW